MAIKSIKVLNVMAFQQQWRKNNEECSTFDVKSGDRLSDMFELQFSDGINVLIGENGVGKTTLLKLLSGEIKLTTDSESGLKSNMIVSGKPTIGTLNQIAFKDNSVSLVDEIRDAYSELVLMKEEIEHLRIKIDHSPSDELIEKYGSDIIRLAQEIVNE